MGALTVRTSGQTLKLSGATNSAGTTVGVWSDAAHTQAVTLPATFSADTTFHFVHGSINITVTTPDGAVIYTGEVYPGFPAGTEISPVPTRAQMAAHEAADSATYATFKSLARTPDALITGAVTRDANGAATSATVTWPDGTTGTYTATTVSTAFPGAVDAYTITYSSPATRTYTQPAVTRDATTGAATNVPAIVVS